MQHTMLANMQYFSVYYLLQMADIGGPVPPLCIITSFALACYEMTIRSQDFKLGYSLVGVVHAAT